MCLDFDATISISHSEKQNAAATWKRTFGFHPLLCFLDRPEVAGGEALAALRAPARPRPGDRHGPRLLARSDSVDATHAFAQGRVDRGVDFSFGFPVDARTQAIVDLIPAECWHPAIQTGDEVREGAWVAEATGMIDLGSWPAGSRLILRKERPHHSIRATSPAPERPNLELGDPDRRRLPPTTRRVRLTTATPLARPEDQRTAAGQRQPAPPQPAQPQQPIAETNHQTASISTRVKERG